MIETKLHYKINDQIDINTVLILFRLNSFLCSIYLWLFNIVDLLNLFYLRLKSLKFYSSTLYLFILLHRKFIGVSILLPDP